MGVVKCNFVEKDGKCVCERCGYSIKGNCEKLFRDCYLDNEYPTFVEMAGNLLKSAKDFVSSGFKIADKEEQERRWTICKSCDKYDEQNNRCTQCGCVTSLAILIESKHCPLGKY